MNGNGCLKVLVFLVLLPFVFALPPVGFAVFAFVAYTLYFYRKGRP
jgi:hypothetical protein